MKEMARLLAQFWHISYEEAYENIAEDFTATQRAVLGEYCSDRDSYPRAKRELGEKLIQLMLAR